MKDSPTIKETFRLCNKLGMSLVSLLLLPSFSLDKGTVKVRIRLM